MIEKYKGYRYPKIIVGFAVRLCERHSLSFRNVRDLLYERGVDVSHETVRTWCTYWGHVYADPPKTPSSDAEGTWNIDDKSVIIKGELTWLWRLVDASGEEIEILIQRQRNSNSANQFLKRALKRKGVPPQVMVMDRLQNYS